MAWIILSLVVVSRVSLFGAIVAAVILSFVVVSWLSLFGAIVARVILSLVVVHCISCQFLWVIVARVILS